MAKVKAPTKPKAKPKKSTKVVVKYDLFDLPTAFHKAGLAGLIMLIDSLKARNELYEDEVEYHASATMAEITFTEKLVQKLMDDIYDASVVEARVKSKWAGAELKREESTEETADGKTTKTKYFVYDQVQPKGAFFKNVFDGEKAIWLKLWRDMMWNIPRGRPTTRIPYNKRAEGESSGEGEVAWTELLKAEKAKAKNSFITEQITSALLPGAQSVNAEGIGFEGRADHNLLLHFWSLATLIFVPQQIDVDGSTEFAPNSFSLAIPEVTNLVDFIQSYPSVLAGLSEKARGYRPAEAVIDLAAEGALAFMHHLAELTKLKTEETELKYSIGGVEFLHLVKLGNNIKTMASGRISFNKNLLANYRVFISPKDEATHYRHPLFRRGLLEALLEDRNWHHSFGRILLTFDADVFIRQQRRSEETEVKGPPQFANDAAKKLRYETKLFLGKLERSATMIETERPKAELSVIVNRIVRSYLLARTENKTGIKLDDSRKDDDTIDWKSVPAKFNEEKQKLALSLMYEFRSRREQDFVDHFATTFFSVTQRIAEPDRLELAAALTDSDKPERRDTLKTLTLLSLSANS